MKKRICAVFMLCLLPVLLLSGCGIYVSSLNVDLPDLPAGQTAFILLRPSVEQTDSSVTKPDTEIGQYCEDGWIPAQYGATAVNSGGYRKPLIASENTQTAGEVYRGRELTCPRVQITAQGGMLPQMYLWFCEEYRSFRVALTDADGKILSVSGECSLMPEHHFGWPDEIVFSCADMTFTPVHWELRPVFGRDWTYWRGWAAFLTVLCAAPLTRLYFAKNMRKTKRRLLTVICLLPAALYLTLNVLFLFVPYFRADSRSVDSSALRSVLRFTLFVLAAVVGEIMRMKRKKRREQEET